MFHHILFFCFAIERNNIHIYFGIQFNTFEIKSATLCTLLSHKLIQINLGRTHSTVHQQ